MIAHGPEARFHRRQHLFRPRRVRHRPDEGKALHEAALQRHLGIGPDPVIRPGQDEGVAAQLTLPLQRHDFQRLHQVVKPRQRGLVAGLGDEKRAVARAVLFLVLHEGRLVAVEGDKGQGQGNLDPRLILGHGLKPDGVAFAFIARKQATPLRGGQDAGRLKPLGRLPFCHAAPCAGAEGAVDGTGVMAIPLQRLLKLFPVIAGQKRLGPARLGRCLVRQDGGQGDGGRLRLRRFDTDNRAACRGWGRHRAAHGPELAPEPPAVGHVAVRRDQPFAAQQLQLHRRLGVGIGAKRDGIPSGRHGKARDIGEGVGIGAGALLGLRQGRAGLDLHPALLRP